MSTAQTLKSVRFLEGRGGEENAGQALGVAMPFVHFGGGVAVSHEQKVHLVARFAILHDSPDFDAGGGAGAVDGGVGGIDCDGPEFVEGILAVAALDHDLHGSGGGREAQRLGKLAAHGGGFRGILPFPEDTGEAARIEHAIGFGIEHFEEIFAEVGVVDGAVEAAGPGTFEDYGVERHLLLGGGAAVEAIDAHGAGIGRGEGGEGHEKEDRDSHDTM